MFMVGDVLKIVSNTSNHNFNCGDIVKVLRIDETDDFLTYYVASVNNMCERWWMDESDAVLYKKIDSGNFQRILNYCVENISGAEGYEDYIEENLNMAIETACHGGCILDLDCMWKIKNLTRVDPSYRLYRYIDSKYEESLLELEEEDSVQLMGYIMEYMIKGE